MQHTWLRTEHVRAVLAVVRPQAAAWAGGMRTWTYADEATQAADAASLARGMETKLALADLPASGAKLVLQVLGERDAAFDEIGRFLKRFEGRLHTAGDLGTTQADLQRVAAHTQTVRTDLPVLNAAVGQSVLRCAQAAAGLRHRSLRTALVQGAGATGEAVVSALRAVGVQVSLCDLDAPRAADVAARHGAKVVPVTGWWRATVDLLAPCAVGGALDAARARQVQAWLVCGSANHPLAPGAESVLYQRGITWVPDGLSTAGAVIQGLSRPVCDEDPGQRLAALGPRTRDLLARADRLGVLSGALALRCASARGT